MKYTRIYSDAQGDSRFEECDVALHDRGEIGLLSEDYQVKALQFRENGPEYDYDYHHAPSRQFIFLLDGEIEITTSTGESRIFKGGDILLVEDTTGKCHRARHIKKQTRRSVFVKL